MSWLYTAPFVLLVGVVLGSVLWAIELGHQLGRIVPVDEARASLIEAPILAIVGLLLAFSFSMAGERMALRRAAVLAEASAIGTVWSGTDLVPQPIRSEMRARLRRYVDVRLARIDQAKTKALEDEAARLQRDLWALGVADERRAPEASRQRFVLPAISAMLDASAASIDARANHLPDGIFYWLYGLVVVAGIAVGYRPASEKRSPLLWGLFAVVISGVLLVLLDMDRPRRGSIQTSSAPYVQLRESMRAP